MEEVKEIHTRNLEWGCITNIIDKISDIEDEMEGHWDALINMLADAITEASTEEDPAKVFFGIYQYCFRLYYRLRSNPTKREFNQVSKTVVAGKDVYRITNYDYKTFCWANNAGFGMTITNDYIDLPSSKMTDSQIRSVERRVK